MSIGMAPSPMRGKRALVAMKLPPALDQVLDELQRRSATRKTISAATCGSIRSIICRTTSWSRSDRMSMAHAVELRPPFLDTASSEFAATLPASFKIRGSQQKFILRELMRDKLPPSILQTEKDRLRHSRARMAARPLAFAAGRYVEHGSVRSPGLFQLQCDRNLSSRSSGATNQCRLSPMGFNDPVLMDEEMANSGTSLLNVGSTC